MAIGSAYGINSPTFNHTPVRLLTVLCLDVSLSASTISLARVAKCAHAGLLCFIAGHPDAQHHGRGRQAEMLPPSIAAGIPTKTIRPR